MNLQELLAARATTDGPTRAALIGVGQFGRTLLMQSRRMAALELAVLCDRDPAALAASCRAAGLGEGAFDIVESAAAAARAVEAGRVALTEDPEVAVAAPVDVVIEATGDAEAGARNAVAALDKGRHLVLVTKETDCVIGPLLARRAKQAGLVLTQVDGDQPSLLLALIAWARSLELEIACAGKASEHDFVADLEAGRLRVEGLGAEAPFGRALWSTGEASLAETLARRAAALAAFPQRTPPDACELCIVANGSGLKPDRPELHAPIARTLELPELFRPAAAGGLLSGTGRLDIFNCLRRPDEASFAGGVFVVLETPDRETGKLFAAKGIPVSGDHGHLLAYNPTHLLGVEAPLSILLPHRLGLATGSASVAPVCDVAARATRDLPAGTTLAGAGSHHRVEGLEALLIDQRPLSPEGPLPYFMALGRRLARDLHAGEILTQAAVEAPEDSVLWRLRRDQDSLFRSG